MPKSKLKLKALLKVSEIDLRKDFKQILEVILTIVAREMGVHAGSIILAKEEKPGELEMAATFGLPDDYIERVYNKGVPIASSPSGVVFETGKYYLSPNLFEEPRAKPWHDLGRELGITAQIFMPLKQKGEVIGVMVIYMADPHEFTDDEISFVSIAASQTAAVIENARLYARERQKSKELESAVEERKRAEEAKRFGEYFKAVFNATPYDAIGVINSEGKIEFANDASVEILGWPMEELIGLHFIKLIPSDFQGFVCQRWEEVQRGEGKPYETDIVGKDGTRKSLLGSHSHLDIDGERKFIVVLKDITELKRLQESEKEAAAERARAEVAEAGRKRLEDTLEGMIDGVAVIDLNGTVIQENKAVNELFGYKTVIGKSITEFIAEEDLQRVLDVKNRVLDTGKASTDLEFMTITKDKKKFPAMGSISPLKDENGKIAVVIGVLRDVTERKHAEEDLKASEERFRGIYENIADVYYRSDVDANLIMVSPSGLKTLGYESLDEMIGRPIASFWTHLERREAFMALMQEKGAVNDHEVTLNRKDGSTLEIATSSRFYYDADGKPLGVEGIFRDITERKLMERALQKSEQELQMILDSVPISIFHVDSNSTFVYANKNLANSFGLEPADFKDKSTRELFPEAAEEYIKSDEEILESGEPQIRKISRIRTPEGVRWVRLDKVPIKDADGSVTGMIGFELDITGRQRAEAALKESEEKLSGIVYGSSIPTFVIDNRHTITHWNKACENLTRLSADVMVGTKKQWAAFYPGERPVMADVIVDGISEEEIARYYSDKYGRSALLEDAYEAVDFFPALGEEGKWLFFTAAPLRDTKGVAIGAIETLQDITARKRLEEERARAAKERLELINELTQRNIELENFVRAASHDLKTPLRGITTLAQWLSTDYADKLDEEGNKRLDLMVNRAKKMHRLLDDILHYTETTPSQKHIQSHF